MGTCTCTWVPVLKPTDPYLHVGAGTDAHSPEGAGENPYNHVEAGPDAHRPEGARRKPYMHEGGPRRLVRTRACTWESVWTPTVQRGPVATRTCR